MTLSLEEFPMFDRFSTSFRLAGDSFQVLRQDKKLIVFPILSGIGCTLVVLSFLLPLFIIQPAWLQLPRNGQIQSPWPYLLLFAFYFCNYFVVVFCNAALISCAIIRFNGGEPSLGDGISAAASRLPQILAWALVSATVGVVLKVIESAHEKGGEIISSILGTAWAIMTYFVVPVLVVEQVGPVDAVKRSMSVLRHTWGEALVGNFSIGLIIFLLGIPGFLLLAVGAAIAASHPAIGIGIVLLAVIYYLLLGAVSTALHNIYVGALYQYATHGSVPQGFDEYSMRSAFSTKR